MIGRNLLLRKTEEDLNMAAKRNPQVSRAVVELRELSNDERARSAGAPRKRAAGRYGINGQSK